MDGRYENGYAMEESYKPAIPIPQTTFNVPHTLEQHVDYPHPMHMEHPHPMQMEHPPRHLWSGPPVPNAFAAPAIPPPQLPPNFSMWPFVNPPPVETTRPHKNPIPTPPPTAAEVHPPPPYSPPPPTAETDDTP